MRQVGNSDDVAGRMSRVEKTLCDAGREEQAWYASDKGKNCHNEAQ
jgi:hypothetical protein